MLFHVYVLLITLGVARLAASLPTPDAGSEPEIDLIRRQTLAEVYTSCTVSNTVALTFDDGPYIYESDIVDTLNEAGIKATFFLNGDNWSCIYDDDIYPSVQHAYDSGHLIGSHSWAHLNLSEQTSETINDELSKMELALTRIIGASPRWFRPPYGDYNDLVRSVSAERNQQIVNWDFDSGDAAGSTVEETKQAYIDLANEHPDSILTLNHETHASTAYDVLPWAIAMLKEKGYEFATVSECLGGQPDYQSQVERGTKDSSWVC